MADESTGFLARLKRHHIYRVATFYAIASWVIIQLSNQLLPDFGLPKSSVIIIIAILGLGFPVILVMAWMLIKPLDPRKVERWQRRRWRTGPLLTILAIGFATTWIIFIWGKVASESATSAAKVPVLVKNVVFNPPPHSIAVLPFQNLSNNKKQQYFSDGITQELTNALGQIPGLQVIAWQSVAKFSNTTLSANAIGKELSVAYMLVGSVMRSGNELRVYAELVNTSTGYQIWSNKYDRSIKDIFAVQDNISRAIANAMQLELVDNTHLVPVATVSPQAHDAYLKGMEYFNTSTKSGLYKAITLFIKAVNIDPNYAEAYAQLANAYTLLPEHTAISYKVANAKAMPVLHKALTINPNQPKAHAVLANIYITEHKIDAAKTELLKALALDPNDAAAHSTYGELLPLKEELAQYKIAARLDPEIWPVQMNLALAYAELGHISEAIKTYKAAQLLAPKNIQAPLEIAYLNHLLSNDRESVRVLSNIKTSNKEDSEVLDASRLSYAAVLNPKLKSQALKNLNKLTKSKSGGFNPYYLAVAYLVLGDKAKAIPLIQIFCSKIPDDCNDIAVDPHYLSLHSSKQFQDLVSRYGLKH